eukprot:CAMPEP_0184659514 /NCGR_PEP_ID=MMETSP0308-20130426/29908_1 /TAXON_ID=38269 /ORGANISM="Gloeochaete witrockiana, Strain SAG 46.84" /LENGTH=272 /DNA_ID=CAMNT_0027099391 /DNA_START=165 /DNA_END=983 /DNA_ORIENTATION=-
MNVADESYLIKKRLEGTKDCGICHEILYEPMIFFCCGKTACRICITKIPKELSFCPFCKATHASGKPPVQPNRWCQEMLEMVYADELAMRKAEIEASEKLEKEESEGLTLATQAFGPERPPTPPRNPTPPPALFNAAVFSETYLDLFETAPSSQVPLLPTISSTTRNSAVSSQSISDPGAGSRNMLSQVPTFSAYPPRIPVYRPPSAPTTPTRSLISAEPSPRRQQVQVMQLCSCPRPMPMVQRQDLQGHRYLGCANLGMGSHGCATVCQIY